MKTIFLSLLFFICSQYLLSQQWVQPGAEWYYNYSSSHIQNPPPPQLEVVGYSHLVYTADSLIQGRNCMRLDLTHYLYEYHPDLITHYYGEFQEQPRFIHYNGDTLFHWQDNQFHTLFCFNAHIGDTILLETNSSAGNQCNDSSFVQVIDTGTTTINGQNLRFIELGSLNYNSDYEVTGLVVEHIGPISAFFFPLFTHHCDISGTELIEMSFCSFNDDSIQYNPTGADCEYYRNHLGLVEEEHSFVSIAPNPVSAILVMNSNTLLKHCFLRSAAGNLVMEIDHLPFEKQAAVDVHLLQPGIYFLTFSDYEGGVQTIRFIKE